MGAFKGYLIKLGNREFPGEFILSESYKVKLNKLEESYRDGNQDLHRDVINVKATCAFTVPSLNNDQLDKFMSMIEQATTLKAEDRLEVECWVPKERNYRSYTAYMPDLEIIVRRHTTDDIIYQSMDIEFIEY